MRSHPMAYHRTIQRTMYTDEDNCTDLIGAFCELLFPREVIVTALSLMTMATNGLFN